MNERLIDLDELVLRCKDKVTQEYIKEAVACYKAGAFRSCIISTWNAVVFDYLYKLRQLELTGDRQAKQDLTEFQGYSSSEDYKKLWEFESKIPDKARANYEFISPIEKEDLERLQRDRSRCAHPSITSIEEPFQATPELARYHLRNAVMHFLQYPPVHGRVAIEHIWNTIESVAFPEDTEEAIEILKNSYLTHARKSFIRDVVDGLTKKILNKETIEIKEKLRYYAALEAISKLHFEEFQDRLSTKLSTIIDSVSDNKWFRVFEYLHRMQIWDLLNEGQRIKAINLIKTINELEGKHIWNIFYALNLNGDEIQLIALEKLKELSLQQDLTPFIEFIQNKKNNIKNERLINQIIIPYSNNAIQGFIDSRSFSTTEIYGDKLIFVASWLNDDQMKTILNGFCSNDQIWGTSKKVPEMMANLFQKTIKIANSVRNEWLLVRERIADRLVYADLIQLIEDNFPDLVSNLNTNKEDNDSYARESDE
jgi:hypothetical protein